MSLELQILLWTIIIAIGTIVIIMLTIKFRPKKELPKSADPEISDAKNCLIGVFIDRPHPKSLGHNHPTKKEVWCEFTANNAKGTKDCTLSSVQIELLFKNGTLLVNGEKQNFATSLPVDIFFGKAKNIIVYGLCEPSLQPDENIVEGIIKAKFNTGQIKNIKSTFMIKNSVIDRKLFSSNNKNGN